MNLSSLRVAVLFCLATLVSAACSSSDRSFSSGSGGHGGTGSDSSTSSSGTGGQPGTGGAAGAGQSSTGIGGMGAEPGAGGSAGAPGTGGGGGGDGACVWLDITADSCSSGIIIANFCPDGRHVTQLERCTDGTLYTPDAAYQRYLLSGCPDVCTIASDHVSWRRIECCR